MSLVTFTTSRSSNAYHHLRHREIAYGAKLTPERRVINNIKHCNVSQEVVHFSSSVEAVTLDDRLELLAIATLTEVSLYSFSDLKKPIWKQSISTEAYNPDDSSPFISYIKIIPSTDKSVRASVVWVEANSFFSIPHYQRLHNICKAIIMRNGNTVLTRCSINYIHGTLERLICFIGQRVFIAPTTSCFEIINNKLENGSITSEMVVVPRMDDMLSGGQTLKGTVSSLVCVDKALIYIYDLGRETKTYALGVEALVHYPQETLKIDSESKLALQRKHYSVKRIDIAEEKLFCTITSVGFKAENTRSLSLLEFFKPPTEQRANLAIVDLETHRITYKYPAKEISMGDYSTRLIKTKNWYIASSFFEVWAINWNENRMIALAKGTETDEEIIGSMDYQGNLVVLKTVGKITIYDSEKLDKLAEVKSRNLRVAYALSPTRLCSAANKTLVLWNFLKGKLPNESEEKEMSDALELRKPV